LCRYAWELAEDANIKKIESVMEGMETVCCGWGHKVGVGAI
jgi:hypothetical protein